MFGEKQVLHCDKFKFVIFFPYRLSFLPYLYKSLSLRLPPTFSSESYIVLALVFWSGIHFKLIFVCDVSQGLRFRFLACDCPYGKIVLSSRNGLQLIFHPHLFALLPSLGWGLELGWGWRGSEVGIKLGDGKAAHLNCQHSPIGKTQSKP